MAGMIQKAAASLGQGSQGKPQGINAILNSILDGEGMRKRFDELLGKRAPQFVSSLITLINADPKLQQAVFEAPNTVIQSALKAAMYDLPIDPGLGYAYIVPFENTKKLPDGSQKKVREASFIMGYKGMEQLAIRSGVYSRVPDAIDVREGELIRYDRLTGDAEFAWMEDEDEREARPIVGYAGYFRLLNGAEKTIFMTKKQIENHERKNRKGKYQGRGWREDFDSMARKTVLRRLIGKYGVMSIDYRMQPDTTDVSLAAAVASGDFDREDGAPEEPNGPIEAEYTVDESTGEVRFDADDEQQGAE